MNRSPQGLLFLRGMCSRFPDEGVDNRGGGLSSSLEEVLVVVRSVVLAVAVFVALSLATQENASSHSGNPYKIIPNTINHLCLQPEGGSASSGAKIEQSVCNGGVEEQFNLIDVGGGWHQIKGKGSGLCLDVPGGSTSWVQLIQWSCHSGDNQKFTVAECFTGCKARILAKHSFMCLDIPGGSEDDGEGIFQWHCNGGINQDFSIHNDTTARQKTGFPERWYHGTCTSGCSPSWMTLPFHRNVPAGLQTAWNPAIDNALGSWNTTTNTVYLDEDPSGVVYPNHDIILNATQFGCWSIQELGRDDCVPSFAFAATYWLQLDKSWACPTVSFSEPPPSCSDYRVADTWWWTIIGTREQSFTDYTSDTGVRAILRQGTVSHEAGHGVFLRHDNSAGDPEALDGLCGVSPLRYSVMDGDCLFNLVLNTVQPWDSCGVNHAYYDPNWGYAGC